MSRAKPILLIGLLMARCLVFAQTNQAPKLEAADSIGQAASALQEIRPGVFSLGKLELDKNRKTVSFPAELHMTNAPLEYLLVSAHGKRHESLLLTDIQPVHVHAAMLLLGAKPAGNTLGIARPATAPIKPEPLEKPSSISLPGNKVSITVDWVLEGQKRTQRAEALIVNTQNTHAVREGHWVYNGSAVINRVFTAQLLGDMISLVTDPAALVNNEAIGHDNDDVWIANTKTVPPLKTPVQVTIELQNPPAMDGKKSQTK